MTSGNDQTVDTAYAATLQQLMKDCLPPILVEIVERRPSDPIQYLATSLYQYRKRNDVVVKTSHVVNAEHAQGRTNGHTDGHTDGHTHERSHFTSFIHSDSNGVSEDPIYDHKNSSHANFTQDYIHIERVLAMTSLGDIFDDDDVT
ncbi:uncharacterized protein LOC127880934 [Dreissena polymorpha]|uniref:Uncharacterized protein n=1 Tax=Dreissena polymorpha TaxID=45954 RepID=A0A9D4H3E7_DREPO|nr:uncharacterized protein LOC127880934 [Dreissena polymorpha]KAH3827830.1 hypothetical protein DPMN_129773 [Dreissena polymorpha]